MLMVIFLADSMCVLFVFPLAPFLVRFFLNFDALDSRVGYYTGLVAAAYPVGRVCSSTHWGALSDRIGRRPCILAGCVGNIVFLVAFGFAPTYWACCLFRFLQLVGSL